MSGEREGANEEISAAVALAAASLGEGAQRSSLRRPLADAHESDGRGRSHSRQTLELSLRDGVRAMIEVLTEGCAGRSSRSLRRCDERPGGCRGLVVDEAETSLDGSRISFRIAHEPRVGDALGANRPGATWRGKRHGIVILLLFHDSCLLRWRCEERAPVKENGLRREAIHAFRCVVGSGCVNGHSLKNKRNANREANRLRGRKIRPT